MYRSTTLRDIHGDAINVTDNITIENKKTECRNTLRPIILLEDHIPKDNNMPDHSKS